METENKHFPFLGLHVYHRAQEALTEASHGQVKGSLRHPLEALIRTLAVAPAPGPVPGSQKETPAPAEA